MDGSRPRANRGRAGTVLERLRHDLARPARRRTQLVAGVARADVVQVAVVLDDGPPLRAAAIREPGFPLPVWSAELPRGAAVLRLVAYGEGGAELGRRLPPPSGLR